MSSTGTYKGDSLIITRIDPMRANGGNGKSSHFRQFALRQDANYVDDDGLTIEKQPADFLLYDLGSSQSSQALDNHSS